MSYIMYLHPCTWKYEVWILVMYVFYLINRRAITKNIIFVRLAKLILFSTELF